MGLTWLIIVAAAILVAMSLIRLRIDRDPSREGEEDRAVAIAFDRLGNLAPFRLVRRLALRRFPEALDGGTVLDAGCGPGYLVRDIARRFPGSAVIGLDISQDMLRLALPRIAGFPDERRPQLVNGDVQCLPFKDGSVDFVVSTLSLHHWREPPPALSEFYRVLKSGGRLLILDPRRDMPVILLLALWLGQALGPAAIRQTNGAVGSAWASYTPGELADMLSASPFQEWSVSGRFGWMLGCGRKKPD